MKAKSTRPRPGDFCAVYWNDACLYKEGDSEHATLIPCVTCGILNRIDRRTVTLSQSRFTHSDGSYGFHEIQVIPRSQVTRITIGRRAKK